MEYQDRIARLDRLVDEYVKAKPPLVAVPLEKAPLQGRDIKVNGLPCEVVQFTLADGDDTRPKFLFEVGVTPELVASGLAIPAGPVSIAYVDVEEREIPFMKLEFDREEFRMIKLDAQAGRAHVRAVYGAGIASMEVIPTAA